jgi:hypothetical protein
MERQYISDMETDPSFSPTAILGSVRINGFRLTRLALVRKARPLHIANEATGVNVIELIICLMNRFIAFSILISLPVAALAQPRYWEKWKAYSAKYDYGPSTTYVNMRSRATISSSPLIYSFETRISEEGVSPYDEYRLLVNCNNKMTMYLSQDSTNKWIKSTGKFARIVADACR